MNNRLKQELEAVLELQTGDTFTADHIHTLVNGIFAADEGGEFKYVEYDSNAFPNHKIGDTTLRIAGLGYADESMLKTVFIMPNKETNPDATMMIVVDEVNPPTDPKTYQYVYVGDINDLNLLTEEDIVNDLTTGGTNRPLSAEQGKILKGITTAMSFTTCDSEASEPIKTISIPGYLDYVNGGSIKIKFSHENTSTDQVKLKINDLAAKPIYYNNLEVTENNTWKDDEVVEVYYDGTRFNCLQLGGGSGSGNGFYNLNNEHPLEEGNTYTLELAVETVANDTKVSDEQKNGMIITFWDDSEWKTYRYSLVYDPESPSAETDFANVDNWKEFESGGGGGGSENGRIVLQRITQNFITKVGDPVNLQFYFDHVDSEGQSTGNNGTATITVLRGGIITASFTRTLSKGTINLDMTDKCGIGINNIRIVVIVDTGLVQQSAALAWSIQEVKLDLTSTLTGHTILNQGDNLQVTYTLESGSVENKSVVCYVDGVQYNTQSQTASISNGVFNIDTTGMTHGQHTIQLRASQRTGQVDEHGQELMLYSNLIYSVIGVKTISGSTPFAMALFDIPDGSTVFGAADVLTFNVNQYDLIKVKFSAWSTLMPVAIEIMDGQNVLHSSSNYGTEEGFDIRVLTSGSHAYSIAVDETPKIAFNVNAIETELGVEVPNGRTLYLDAVEHGHNNSDINRNTWTNTEGDIETTTTFTDFTWTGDGWINNALRLKGSARATINYKPLQRNTSGGMAVGFKFKVSEISDEYGEKLISCVDNTNTGFYITANGVYIVQNNTILTQMLIAEDTVYDVEFVAWPEVGTGSDAQKNAHFVYIYIDGIISGGYRIQTSGSSIFQNIPSNISLGVSTATLDLYRVWGYRRALNDNESLNCYILDQDDNIDLLFKKRDNNNILNAQGGVTPDSLPDGTRIMIITGTAIGTAEYGEEASVLAAAHRNKKSDYFPCTEISSYIKGATDRSKNFIAHNNGSDIVEGQDLSLKLRLQGTSSLAYPVKNYRIYTKKSTMYVGNNPESVFGETGELVSGGKFAMHDTSAPVAVWCLKADYAESSSSHNTGMACMVNDTLKHTNIKTPAQRDVDTTQYPYEVRTTVDGEPCILFYRETLNDAPIFLGKFNFNNDKSTEAVYGFTGIKGYHNVAPLNNEDNNETEFVAQQYKTKTGTSLGVDLTECWEFRNNEDPMGSFLDDDFVSTRVDPDSGDTIPKWTGTFEARYPDEDDLNDQFASGNIVPHYLSTLVSWVKSTGVLSTDTEEQATTKLTKFRNELSLYFDVEHLCSYFVFTQVMACLDQMVKNMMMAFWYDKNADNSSPMGKVRAYMIFYDNDTILGVINNGRLLAPYNVTRQTIQMYDAQQNPVYFYAGHESVLWNNLATQFPTEIRNAYVKLRGYLTNARIFQYFDVQQTDKFCERIYNLDALNKYVAPTGMSENQVAPYRDLMQGNRKSHRHFFVNKRMSIFDNEWRAGEYYSAANEISYKGISAADSAIGFTLKQAGNVEVQSDVSDDFVRNYVVSGNTPTMIGKLTPSAVGTIFHVYGMRQLTSLNLAAWDFDQLNLGNFQYLEEFVFGAKSTLLPVGRDWRNSGGYIEGNGTQYIDTGVLCSGQTTKVVVDCVISNSENNNNKYLFGANNSVLPRNFSIQIGGESSNLQIGTENRSVNITKDERITLSLNKDGLYLNDSKISNGTPQEWYDYRSKIAINAVFENNSVNSSNIGYNKFYSVKIYQRDTLVCEMYPAVDNSGVACMYDYVSGQFFYNQGTGTFTVSDEVINANIDYVNTDNPFTKPYYNSGLILGDSMPRLKRFIAQNLDALPTADLSGCHMIEEIDLTGSKAISSVNIPVGAPLTKYKLPTAGIIKPDWRNSGGYIEFNHTYIDTMIGTSSNLIVEFKFSLISVNSGIELVFFLGKVDDIGRQREISLFFQSTANKLTYNFGGLDKATPSYTLGDEVTVYFSKDLLKLNGTQVGTGVNFKGSIYPIRIGDLSNVLRVKYLKIRNTNNENLSEMYPAVDDNGVACMYDYVTGKYYYNKGTGILSVSQEVIDANITSNVTPFNLALIGLPQLGVASPLNWRELKSWIYNCNIHTGIMTSADKKIVMEFEVVKQSSEWNMIGGGVNYNNRDSEISLFSHQNTENKGFGLQFNYRNVNAFEVTNVNINQINIAEISKNGYKLNGTVITSTQYSGFSGSTEIMILGGSNGTDIVKFYSFKVYDNNVLICEMYPAVDDNGVACMYDYVTNSFFYNNSNEMVVSDNLRKIASPFFNDFDIGLPSKIQSLTFRDCPNINGFDLLKTIAEADNTLLSTVNVTLPSAISGPIEDLITITNLWNQVIGEGSNLKVYGSYTVTDEFLTKVQCDAIGYDPSGAATQMSSKIYGLMVTIDQSTITEIVLQSYDPNGEGYNPAVCVKFEQGGYGTYVNANDYTQGWYMTRVQAQSITSFSFSHVINVTDSNGICGIVGQSYDFTSFEELNEFGLTSIPTNCFENCRNLVMTTLPTTITQLGEWCFFYCLSFVNFIIPESITSITGRAFQYCSGMKTFVIPSTVKNIGEYTFSHWDSVESIYIYATTPPTAGYNLWESTSRHPKIYVPADSVNIYKSAAGWSDRASDIEAIPNDFVNPYL